MKGNMKRRFVHCGVIFALTTLAVFGLGWIENLNESSNEENETSPAVEFVSEKILVVGGQSIGIRMDVKGVLVVGLEELETEDGIVSPGYDAGIQIGDRILSINGNPVDLAKDVEKLLYEETEPVRLEILRQKEIFNLQVTPVKTLDGGGYKMGLWVKEKIAGIGTLSFYDPDSNVYAALGHGIYESQTGTLLEVASGELLKTEVKSIQEGQVGKPGEIRGIFYGEDTPMGEVKRNSIYGIYSTGKRFDAIQDGIPMVMATQSQIETGEAKILTTINGTEVEEFDIEIKKINKQDKISDKGLEIEVTDQRLLEYCGGIVQGMSGSPIIQNNRIVGAVTHVLVNNPTKGYGIFAEWMVEEAKTLETP